MNRFYGLTIKLTEYLAIVLLVLTSGIMVVQVFFRYVLNSSIGWSDEIMGFLLVWTTFTGAVLAMHDKSHIGIDLLLRLFPARSRWTVDLLVNLLTLIFLLIFTYFSTFLCVKLFNNYAISIRISMSVIYSILPLSGFLMIVVIIRRVSQIINEVYKKSGWEKEL